MVESKTQTSTYANAAIAVPVSEFLTTPESEMLNALLAYDRRLGYVEVSHDQVDAWRTEISLLKRCLAPYPGNHIILEYSLPRSSARLDAVLLLNSKVVVIEFKVGQTSALANDIRQVCDYALNLAYYHKESAGLPIIPVLCPTEATDVQVIPFGEHSFLRAVNVVGANSLADFVASSSQSDNDGNNIDLNRWVNSRFEPIPGIVDAARDLFNEHQVADIKSALAQREDIDKVVQHVVEFVDAAARDRKKLLLIVSGVPGSGKTLVGLQIVHRHRASAKEWKAAFLSGNRPLMNVLRHALETDYKKQGRSAADAKAFAHSLLHNVHNYLGDVLKGESPPLEHVVVFDEAQRAWDSAKMAKSSKGAATNSEPHQIMSVIDRHAEGAVVVALCGDGQDIHDGESGIDEWLNTHRDHFPHWEMKCASPSPRNRDEPRVAFDEQLDLRTPVRSHRANSHAKWVQAVLDFDPKTAREFIDQRNFPIVLTRELEDARRWLRQSTAGTRRFGLLASSEAKRLRPYGIEVSKGFRDEVDFPLWFTGDRDDFRSSFGLEVAATEFECQGLELDRVGVCWCWDLIVGNGSLRPRRLFGSKWRDLKASERTYQYALNKYRVLLTRAREGMVIWVPKGMEGDPTRSTEEADSIAAFLIACGVEEV